MSSDVDRLLEELESNEDLTNQVEILIDMLEVSNQLGLLAERFRSDVEMSSEMKEQQDRVERVMYMVLQCYWQDLRKYDVAIMKKYEFNLEQINKHLERCICDTVLMNTLDEFGNLKEKELEKFKAEEKRGVFEV